MFVKLSKFLLSCYLVIFLIGGGRVCACEAVSWIGIDLHNLVSIKSDKGHCHGGSHDHDHGDQRDHDGQSDNSKDSPKQCCELALQLIEIILSKNSIQDEFEEIPFTAPLETLNFRTVPGSHKKSWKDPPPTVVTFLYHTLVSYQRFNL